MEAARRNCAFSFARGQHSFCPSQPLKLSQKFREICESEGRKFERKVAVKLRWGETKVRHYLTAASTSSSGAALQAPPLQMRAPLRAMPLRAIRGDAAADNEPADDEFEV